jgi:hypothetical protein
VVAEDRVVEPDLVPRVDHLRAPVRDRLNRGRDGVAGEQEERVGRLPHHALAERRDAREPAARAAVGRREAVHVVDLEECDAHRAGARRLLPRQRRVLCEEECGEQRECECAPARAGECHRVESPFLENVRELVAAAPFAPQLGRAVA